MDRQPHPEPVPLEHMSEATGECDGFGSSQQELGTSPPLRGRLPPRCPRSAHYGTVPGAWGCHRVAAGVVDPQPTTAEVGCGQALPFSKHGKTGPSTAAEAAFGGHLRLSDVVRPRRCPMRPPTLGGGPPARVPARPSGTVPHPARLLTCSTWPGSRFDVASGFMPSSRSIRSTSGRRGPTPRSVVSAASAQDSASWACRRRWRGVSPHVQPVSHGPPSGTAAHRGPQWPELPGLECQSLRGGADAARRAAVAASSPAGLMSA